jgi:CRISPR/Cas system-associated protein Cas10 (large subunit of type III CRISPR-Cas system)
MKVKVKESTITEKEIELEYPIYLYFQSELDEDEVVKAFPNYKISVLFTVFGVKIIQEKYYGYSESQVRENLTTEEHFNEAFEEALQHIVKLKA